MHPPKKGLAILISAARKPGADDDLERPAPKVADDAGALDVLAEFESAKSPKARLSALRTLIKMLG